MPQVHSCHFFLDSSDKACNSPVGCPCCCAFAYEVAQPDERKFLLDSVARFPTREQVEDLPIPMFISFVGADEKWHWLKPFIN